MNNYDNFYDEYDDFGHSNGLGFDDFGSVKFIGTDSISTKVKTLSEVFIEWYLFDSSSDKSISEFLKSEKLDKILSEDDFNDIVQGVANLDDDTITYIAKKLPFDFNINKLDMFNTAVGQKSYYQRTIKTNPQYIATEIERMNSDKTERKKEQKAQYHKKYRAENLERLKATKDIWYKNNYERVIETNKRWREKNPDKVTESRKKWFEQNPEKVKESRKKWNEQNPEKIKESNKRWREANPDKVKARYKRWCDANPDKVKAAKQRYRAANPEKAKEQSRRGKIKLRLKKTGPVLLSLVYGVANSKQK